MRPKMEKARKLARVLKKCNKNDNDKAGNITLIILGAFLAVGLFFAGFYLKNFEFFLGPIETIFTALYFIATISLLLLFLPRIISSLFMASDIDSLLILPFSSLDIVLARLFAFLPTAMGITAVAIFPMTLGYIISGGFDLFLSLANLLAIFFIPAGLFAISSILLTILFKFIKKLRSRDLMTIIGAFLAIALCISMLFIQTEDTSSTEATQAFIGGLASGAASACWGLPYLAFLGRAISGDILSLIASVIIFMGISTIFYVVMKRFYISVALSIRDSSSSSKALTDDQFAKTSTAKSISSALFRKELRMFFRNPSYIMNGWASMFIGIATICIMDLTSSSSAVLSMDFVGNPVGTTISLVTGVTLAISLIASYMNTAGFSCISREGQSFFIMKTLAVSYETQIRAKRNFAIFVSMIGSTFPLLIASIIGVVTGIIEWWGIPLMLVLNILILISSNNLRVIQGIKKPNLNWTDEAMSVKTDNLKPIIVLIIGLVLSNVIPMICNMGPENNKILAVITGIIIVFYLILLPITNHILMAKSVKRLHNL